MYVLVCQGCGRSVDSIFRFCPWCGEKRSFGEGNEEFEKESRSMKIENDRLDKIDEMDSKLEKLEEELEVLVLSAEMHK